MGIGHLSPQKLRGIGSGARSSKESLEAERCERPSGGSENDPELVGCVAFEARGTGRSIKESMGIGGCKVGVRVSVSRENTTFPEAGDKGLRGEGVGEEAGRELFPTYSVGGFEEIEDNEEEEVEGAGRASQTTTDWSDCWA